jgi:hypothetical protein
VNQQVAIGIRLLSATALFSLPIGANTGFNHFGWIDDPIELHSCNETELKRGYLQSEIVVHRDLRRFRKCSSVEPTLPTIVARPNSRSNWQVTSRAVFMVTPPGNGPPDKAACDPLVDQAGVTSANRTARVPGRGLERAAMPKSRVRADN